MAFSIFLVADHSIQIYIFNTLENISFYEWVLFLHFADQFLDLHALGTVFFVVAGGAGVGKLAGTLNEMKMIVISSCLDIIFPYQIQRTDQFHAFKVGAVKLWHHGLDLGSVEHAHEDGFDNIIIMMS